MKDQWTPPTLPPVDIMSTLRKLDSMLLPQPVGAWLDSLTLRQRRALHVTCWSLTFISVTIQVVIYGT